LGRTYPGQIDSTYRADGVIRISPNHGVVAWKVSGESGPSPAYKGIDTKGVTWE